MPSPQQLAGLPPLQHPSLSADESLQLLAVARRLRSTVALELCPMPVEQCTLMLAYDGFRFFVVEAGALFNGFSWATSALFGLSHKRFLL